MKLWERCTRSHFACYSEAALGQTGPLNFGITHCFCVLLVVRLKHSWQYTATSLKCLSQLIGFWISYLLSPQACLGYSKTHCFSYYLSMSRKSNHVSTSRMSSRGSGVLYSLFARGAVCHTIPRSGQSKLIFSQKPALKFLAYSVC